MLYVQILAEYEIDEEALVEDFRAEWEEVGSMVGHNHDEFLDYLLDNNLIGQDDLGEPVHRSVMLL